MALSAGGKYTAKATGSVVLGKSKNKETPFIEFYLQVKGGENDGARVRWTSYFSEKTYERTVQSLETCGWTGEDISVFSDGKLHGLDKNEVEIVVELEEYETPQGEKRTSPRVAWVNRLGYLNVDAAMSTDAAAAFGVKMNDLILAMRAKNPRKSGFESSPATSPEAAHAEMSSDDIPF
jgi:hypothetical protein